MFWTPEQHSYMKQHEDELREAYATDKEAEWTESEEYKCLFGDMDLLSLFGAWEDWND